MKGYRLLINKMSNRVIKREINRVVRENFGKLVFQTEIHDRIAVVEASGQSIDVLTHDPESASAKEYLTLAQEFLKNYGKKIV